MNVWHRPGAIERLKELCSVVHMSASRIAAELSEEWETPISRNAIIGKCKRLDIPLPGAGRVAQGRPRPAFPGERRPHAQRPLRVYVPRNRPRCEPVDTPAAEDDAGAPIAGGVTLLELGHEDCRWPFGNPLSPGLRFCGQRIEPGRFYSFCAFHLRRGTERPRPPKPTNDRRRP